MPSRRGGRALRLSVLDSGAVPLHDRVMVRDLPTGVVTLLLRDLVVASLEVPCRLRADAAENTDRFHHANL